MTRCYRPEEARKGALSPFVVEWAGSRVKSIKKGIKTAGASIGHPDASPHMLRYSAAEWLAEDGTQSMRLRCFSGTKTAHHVKNLCPIFANLSAATRCLAGGVGSMNL